MMITGAGNVLTLSDDYDLSPADGQLLNMDAGGSARDVTLPLLSEPTGGLFFIIYNSGGENLVFKNVAGSTVITLAALSSCILVSTAPDTWTVVQSSAASATAADDVGVTDSGDFYTAAEVEAVLAELGAVRVYEATGTIANGAVRTLNATPVQVIAAPGAGKYIEVLSAEWFLDYATAGFDAVAAGDDLALKYTNASGAKVTGDLAGVGFADQTSDQLRLVKGVAVTPAINAAIVAHILVGEWYAAAGGSALDYKIRYMIRTAST
jgi:hypothetical protein